jgi:hypothetical protein
MSVGMVSQFSLSIKIYSPQKKNRFVRKFEHFYLLNSRGGIISEEHPVTLSRGLRQERVLVRF